MRIPLRHRLSRMPQQLLHRRYKAPMRSLLKVLRSYRVLTTKAKGPHLTSAISLRIDEARYWHNAMRLARRTQPE